MSAAEPLTAEEIANIEASLKDLEARRDKGERMSGAAFWYMTHVPRLLETIRVRDESLVEIERKLQADIATAEAGIAYFKSNGRDHMAEIMKAEKKCHSNALEYVRAAILKTSQP